MKIFFSMILGLVFVLGFGQRTVETGDFSAIETFDQLTIKLVQSDKNEIEITGERADDVDFVNKNGSLKLRMKTKDFMKGKGTVITVYYKNLNSIRASEGSLVGSDEKLNLGSISLNAKEGANISLNMDVNNLVLRTTSGGIISLEGTTNTQDIICNAGGNYAGKDMISKTTNIVVNAGGSADVHATEFVNATTRAGGSINIYGNPEVNQRNVVGGSVTIH